MTVVQDSGCGSKLNNHELATSSDRRTSTSSLNGPLDESSYDTIIVGGGSAGIGAAIGAKQAVPEARVLIVESEGCLGGAATHRGVLSYCGLYSAEKEPRRVVGQIWNELHSRLVKERAASERPDCITGYVQNVEPEGLKRVLDDLMSSYGVSVLLHCTVVGAERQDSRLTAIEVQERRGRRKIYGNSFVDCSGDGDLAVHAKASTRYGNHGHVQLGSLSTRFGGLADANPTSRQWKETILAAKNANPGLRKIIPRNSGILIKLPESGDIVTYLASAAYDARDSASITAAERQGRVQAKVYLDILRELPGHEKMHLVSTGPNFGTRESRHVNSRYQLEEHDLLSGVRFEDTVAIGGWYLEWHDVSKEDWPIHFQAPLNGTFEIPLRCLHSIDTDNLFCGGRCVDGDKAASSAIRVQGTALATGQAAGTAAALTGRNGRIVDAADVRKKLMEHGALLDTSNLPRAVPAEEPEGRNLSHEEALKG